MSLYQRIAGSHLGSSALFGGAFFGAAAPVDGLTQAAIAGSLAAASWFATVPLLKRLISGVAGAR
jgi:hypothetical protein